VAEGEVIRLLLVLYIGVEGADVDECFFEEVGFFWGEVALGFDGEHFEGVEHAGGGFEVDLGFASGGVGELAKEKACVLGLEVNEFVETGVGCGLIVHWIFLWVVDVF